MNILITGASRGIGKALYEQLPGLLEAYYEAMITSPAVSVSVYGFAKHTKPPILQMDVTSEHDIRCWLGEISPLDVVINCAGIASMNSALLMPVETARRILDTNVIGTFLVSREAAKVMLRQKHGCIINVSSVAASLALEGEAIYAASKAAVETLTVCMAKELAPYVRVNCIRLPPIETDLIKGVPKEKLDSLVARLPSKRMGTMQDAIDAVTYLIESDVTGAII